MDGLDRISPGGRRYRAPYGANKLKFIKVDIILDTIFIERKYSSFCQNPNGARIRQWREVKLEQGFLEKEHKLGKVWFSVYMCKPKFTNIPTSYLLSLQIKSLDKFNFILFYNRLDKAFSSENLHFIVVYCCVLRNQNRAIGKSNSGFQCFALSLHKCQ